ncbi:MAG: hypothetical protein JXA10_17315, partial [Anaerolineae bacterium]|nr:hypothetical protein [Anaerolineae bacterium]
NDWYRQALDRRVPRGEGSNLRAALGGIERSQFSRYQALLRLPDPVWEMADRYRLEEKRLRYVLKIEDEALQIQFVRVMIDRELSAERIQQIVESGRVEDFLQGSVAASPRSSEEDILARVAHNWTRLASQVSQADLSVVADQWVKKQPPDHVREQVAALRRLLDIVESRVNE